MLYSMNQWREVLRIRYGARGRNQMIGQKPIGFMIKILVEHHPHSRGKVEAGKKAFVEANASYDVELLIAGGSRTDDEQAERRTIRSFFFFEKGICRGIRACQRILITEFRRPLR